jgi:selenocysteine lyase/cysteine desulfurase
MITSKRHLFDIPRHIAYFNTAGASPLLKSVVQAGFEGIEVKTHPWKISGEHFWDRLVRCRELFAKLVLATADDIAIVPSATYGVETAIRQLKLKANDEVLVQGEEFPALILPLQKLQKESAIKIATVPQPTDFDWTNALLEKISPQTKLIAIGVHHWTDGLVVDLKLIITRAREVGAQVWVDACQTLGAAPFPVPAYEVDFIFAPTYKWLLGPYTFGFLYVHPKHQNASPLEEYWASRMGSDDFSNLTNYESNYRPGAIRFDMSERSQFINAPMAAVALEQILEWSPHRIAESLRIKTKLIADAALDRGYKVAPEKFRAPHFLGLRRPAGFDAEFKARLEKENVFVGYRGDSMRIAPHLFNDEEDIERMIQLL